MVHVYNGGFWVFYFVDLAIDAIEVADGVGVEVNADGQASAASADHGVDVLERLPLPGVFGEWAG